MYSEANLVYELHFCSGEYYVCFSWFHLTRGNPCNHQSVTSLQFIHDLHIFVETLHSETCQLRIKVNETFNTRQIHIIVCMQLLAGIKVVSKAEPLS